jgi:hypothetical protein
LTGTETIEREGATPVPQEPVERTTEESHIAEPKPKTTDKEKAEEMPEPEYPGENISFL